MSDEKNIKPRTIKLYDDEWEEFKKLNFGLEAEVSFETDGYKIHEEIKNHDYLLIRYLPYYNNFF